MLPLLVGGPRDQPARLQTMRAAISWGYELLAPVQKTVFRRLTVFSGGFTYEAAEAVARIEPDAFASAFDGLTQQSFVRAPERGGSRFSLLEPIRQFGLELLSGEEAEITRLAHTRYFLELAEEGEIGAFAADADRSYSDIEREHDNLRAALAWSEGTDDPELMPRLAAALAMFWCTAGYSAEGASWLKRAGVRASEAPAAVRARLLIKQGMLLTLRGEWMTGEALIESGMAIPAAAGDPGLTIQAMIWRGMLADARGSAREGVAMLREAVKIGERIPDQRKSSLFTARAFANLGYLVRSLGQVDEAEAYLQEALRRETAAGYVSGVILTTGDLGDVARDRGDNASALALYHRAIRLCAGRVEHLAMTELIERIAVIAATEHDYERAARLFGAAAVRRERNGLRYGVPSYQRSIETGMAGVSAALIPATVAALLAAGRAATLQDVLDDVFSVHVIATRSHPTAERFTKRELQLMPLLAEGKTNRAIADELFLSVRTVESHVLRLMAKLGVTTRTAAVSAILGAQLIPDSPRNAVVQSSELQ
jgi:non-specific serine/threonine protein kinase